MSVPAVPAIPPFLVSFDVVEADVDMLEHVSNIAYLKWVQDAALAHSAAVGLDIEAYRSLGGVFVVRRHEIDYLRPVLRGQIVHVRTWVDSVFAAKCKRATELAVADPSGAQERIVARAMTTWGFVEFATGRPTRIPDVVRQAFSQPSMRELAAARNTAAAAASATASVNV